MKQRSTWMALFVLFLVALLSPVNNLIQPHEKTNLCTDTEYQVAAMALATGLYVIVAFARMGDLRLNAIRLDFLPRMFSAFCGRHIPVSTACVDTSPSLMVPLRI